MIRLHALLVPSGYLPVWHYPVRIFPIRFYVGPLLGPTSPSSGCPSTGSSLGATTIGNVTSGDAGGPDDATFASYAASVEADFRKATRDDKRLPFWPVPEVRGLFELVMAIGNRGLPTYWECQTCGSGYYSRGINWLLFFCSTI